MTAIAAKRSTKRNRRATQEEIEFLRKLKWKNPKTFAAYRDSVHLRTNWGDIDKSAIEAYLEFSSWGNWF